MFNISVSVKKQLDYSEEKPGSATDNSAHRSNSTVRLFYTRKARPDRLRQKHLEFTFNGIFINDGQSKSSNSALS